MHISKLTNYFNYTFTNIAPFSQHFSHFLETQHCYAMQLGNTRVWDYVGDNFVHRLLQNNEDGKLVEVEGNNNGRRQQSGKEQ